jgi:hypothetical protein
MRALLLLTVIALLAAPSWAGEPFNALARMHEPIPTGHTPGKDNGPGQGLHNAGEDCGRCHTPGGKAQGLVFTIAGTLYQDRMGRAPLEGGEVVLEDVEGHVISVTSNRIGNFWTTAPLASNPKAIASHGGTTDSLYSYDGGVLVPADPEDSRTWQYKAWVRSGEEVRQMVTIAPVGGASATTARMSCNMHHAPLGGSGALWVGAHPSTTPSSPISFKRDVQPFFVERCAPCHIPGARFTRLVTESDVAAAGATSFDYSAGHDFTAYAGSTAGGPKSGVRSVVDPSAPAQSLLFQKTLRPPDGGVVHAGGSFWRETDADYQLVLQWIQEGALDN